MWPELLGRDGDMVFLPSPHFAGVAQRLEAHGLVRISERTYVFCVDTADAGDRFEWGDRTCDGRVVVADGAMEDEVQCPDCLRFVTPRNKQQFPAWEVFPRHDRLRELIAGRISATGLPFREHPHGVFRVTAGFGELHVVFADVLDEECLAPSFGLGGEPAILVLGVPAMRHRYGQGLPWVSLRDLALDRPTALAEQLVPLARSPRAVMPLATSPAPAAPVTATLASPSPRLSLPFGTTWRDIVIYCVDGATVGISAPGLAPAQFAATDLGMAKATNRMPTKRFQLLLHLCRHRGRTDWDSARSDPREPLAFRHFPAFAMQVSALAEDLQRLFGLPDNPFPGFGKHGDLVAAFRALPEAPGELGVRRPAL